MKKYFQAPWTKKEISIVFLSTTIALIALNILLGVSGITKSATVSKTLITTVAFLLQSSILLLPLLAITAKKHKLKAKQFGLKKVAAKKTILTIGEAYLSWIAINIIVQISIFYFDLKIPGYELQESILPLFEINLPSIIAMYLIVGFIAPIVEEVFFRGFLLRALGNYTGIIIASISSAFIFSIVHLQPANIIPIFILGLILNAIVIKTKSIVTSIIFHIIQNNLSLTVQLLIWLQVIPLESVAHAL